MEFTSWDNIYGQPRTTDGFSRPSWQPPKKASQSFPRGLTPRLASYTNFLHTILTPFEQDKPIRPERAKQATKFIPPLLLLNLQTNPALTDHHQRELKTSLHRLSVSQEGQVVES